MKKMNIKSNQGFSLIELSIVLIIIGLLVAGITGGASLITSAELRAIMTEARGYKTAVSAYYTSRDVLPGDDPDTNIGSVEGNENGRIEANINDSGSSLYTQEGVEAWIDMSDSAIGILDLTVTAPPLGNGGETMALTMDMLGTTRYKGAGWTFDYSTTPRSGGVPLTDSLETNALIFTAPTEAEGGVIETTPTVILTGLKAFSIDKKADDGEFTTGQIIGMDANISGAGGAPQTCTEDLSTLVCGLLFKIDL